MIEAVREAQLLALAAKHFSLDPYKLWNAGRNPLPPPRNPYAYRDLVFAMAEWVEEYERMRSESNTAKLLMGVFGPSAEEAAKHKKGPLTPAERRRVERERRAERRRRRA